MASGPLSVLNHLYYYTVQYGLSVNQFTGAHWKYWEKLPEALKKALGNREALSRIIGDLERLTSKSGERLLRRREQRLRGWAEKETVINAQLSSLLSALPGRILSLLVKELTREAGLAREYVVVDLCMEKNGEEQGDGDFVDPDFLLF